MEVLVEDNPARRRFEILVDDALAGFADYRLVGRTVVLVRAEVLPGHDGSGIGEALLRGTLDEIRRRGDRVLARTPTVTDFVDRNPDYRDLLAPV